ncbi:rSAM-modified peptide [Flavobacterium sp. LAR06]
MANMKLKFEDFEAEKLSKNQQKTVRGGDDVTDPVDGTGKGGKGGNG